LRDIPNRAEKGGITQAPRAGDELDDFDDGNLGRHGYA
jgi:hypothetical protein